MRNKTHRFLSLLIAVIMVLCLVPAAAFADSPTYGDGTYKLVGLTSSLSMFNHFDEDACKVEISNGTITMTIASTVDRYDHIAWGKYGDLITDTDLQTSYPGVEGMPNGQGYTFTITLDQAAFDSFVTGGNLYFILKYRPDYINSKTGEIHENAGKWYKPSNDAYLTVTKLVNAADADAAAAVDEKIDAIGDVTLESEEAIKAAREAYDALTDAQKELVTKLADLETAEKKLEELKKADSDADVAAAVDEQIAKIGEVTLESEEAITAARKAYDALTDEQKALVKEENVKALEAAEAKLKELKEAKEAEDAAKAEVELTVTNNTGMFKVVKAVIRTAADGSKTLVFSLSATSYENLFKGTYEEASANGMNKDNWIKGYKNADGKIEFEMPLKDGESYIPVVSISNSYLKKAEAGENPIERAFYPRQFEIDENAKTLVAGDYKNTVELKVTNNVKMFKVESATLTTIGGPNSNGYSKVLELKMGSDSFDKAYIGRASDSGHSETTAIKDRTISFRLLWMEKAGDLDSITDLMAEPIIISWHSVSKDAYYERQFTVSEKNGTLVIDAAPEEEKEQVVLVSITGKDGKEVNFTKKELDKAAQLDKKTAVEKNPNVRAEDEIDILWQKDVKVAAGTEFPATLNFEVSDVESGQQLYVYHFEDGEWKLVGTGLNGKVSAKVESMSPFAVAAKNAKASPQTGDSSVAVWAALAVCAAAIGAAAFITGRKRRDQ